MAIAPPPEPRSENAESLPQRRRWTVAEFERAIDLGLFGPDEHLELIDGEILRKVTQNPPHATALLKTDRILDALFGDGYVVRPQLPLNFGDASGERPEPDIAVVRGSLEDFTERHPQTAVLVVEISDATLDYDRSVKVPLYAAAGIPEMWIINVPERLLEVYRQPVALPDTPRGHGYRSVTRHASGEVIAPLAAPEASVAIADLLP